MPDEATPKPPLPEFVTIPRALIDRWLAISPEAYIQIRLTRADMDNLSAAFMKNIAAQDAFQSAMVQYSNNKLDDANQELHEAKRALIESQNAFRQFYLSIMASAEEVKSSGG